MASLTTLPLELLDIILPYTMPDGFESAALTCSKFYGRCKPLIWYHNRYRRDFENFVYNRTAPPKFPVQSAFGLVSRIADDPIIARYIRHADFRLDSIRDRDMAGPGSFDIGNMLNESPYFSQTDLDAHEYYTVSREEHRCLRYSQYAAEFLLTLLPNVETLVLPQSWIPTEAIRKLMDVVVRRATQPHLPGTHPSLAQLTKLTLSAKIVHHTFRSPVALQDRFDVHWAPFLMLPRLRSLHGNRCVAEGPPQAPYPFALGATLRAVDFAQCCIDHVSIQIFLQQTPLLTTFLYSHCSKPKADSDAYFRDWDLCSFIASIEHAVGGHLEELSILIYQLHGSIKPGSISMTGFQRLRQLKFSLALAVCHLAAVVKQDKSETAQIEREMGNNCLDSLLETLIPASVTQLSLHPNGSSHHQEILEMMFQDFPLKKNTCSLAIEQIYIMYNTDVAEETCKKNCDGLFAQMEGTGVVLRLEVYPGVDGFWDTD